MAARLAVAATGWRAAVVGAVAVAALVAAHPAPGQIVSGGAPSQIPPAVSVNDPRIRLTARFCEHYRAGSVGTSIRELADMQSMFVAMFGPKDWESSTDDEKAEVARLYVEAMNYAHERMPGQTPDPVQPGDVAVTESNAATQPATARVGVTFRTKGAPVRIVLRLEQQPPQGRAPGDADGFDGWRIVDAYAVGDDSWVTNMRKPYQALRGTSTPVVFMRQVHEAVRDAARAQRASTRPSR